MLRLITIPISHYCEKARWALDYAGQRFQEDAHLPMFHLVPTRRAGGRHTVPVLVTPTGTLAESADIVRWADRQLPSERGLFPNAKTDEIERWIEELDAEFGVDTRLWAYSHFLPEKRLVMRYGCAGAPGWQRRLASAGFPILKRVMVERLRINRASLAHATERIDRMLDRIDGVLGDGRPYLTGDRFTAADLTFAALAAAIVAPAEYHVKLPDPEELPGAAERIGQWRERPSGKHALRMFRERRHASA